MLKLIFCQVEEEQVVLTQQHSPESDSYSSGDDQEEFPEFSCSLAKLKQKEAEDARNSTRDEDEKPDFGKPSSEKGKLSVINKMIEHNKD